MPIKRFLLIDGTAALVTTNLFTWLGYYYWKDLAQVIHWLDSFRQAVVVVAVMAGLLVAVRIVQYQMERRALGTEE